MRRITGNIGISLLLILTAATMGCTIDEARALEERDTQTSKSSSAPSQETLVLPPGTEFVAVLRTRLTTDGNTSGDAFVATTVEPIVLDGRTVVPARSRIDGVLRDVQASGRIKGRARMTLVFREIVDTEGKTHDMSALPLTIKAKGEDVALDQGVKLNVQVTGPTNFVVAAR